MLGALALHPGCRLRAMSSRSHAGEGTRIATGHDNRWRIPIAAAILWNLGLCWSTGSIIGSSPSARWAADPLEIGWKSALLNPAWILSLCAANATVGRLSIAAEAPARAIASVVSAVFGRPLRSEKKTSNAVPAHHKPVPRPFAGSPASGRIVTTRRIVSPLSGVTT